ncbi:hypothetical protein [Streptomyces sp. NBC_00207]|uniref:hypothetical protein n=1 Tax=Streptomyces sp. NBC_00207 TaxID=2903635 RepID=UPI00324914DA
MNTFSTTYGSSLRTGCSVGAPAVPAVAVGTTSYAWHFRLGPALAEPNAFHRAETSRPACR